MRCEYIGLHCAQLIFCCDVSGVSGVNGVNSVSVNGVSVVFIPPRRQRTIEKDFDMILGPNT